MRHTSVKEQKENEKTQYIVNKWLYVDGFITNKVYLGTNLMYIFSSNTLFGHEIGQCFVTLCIYD